MGEEYQKKRDEFKDLEISVDWGDKPVKLASEEVLSDLSRWVSTTETYCKNGYEHCKYQTHVLEMLEHLRLKIKEWS